MVATLLAMHRDGALAAADSAAQPLRELTASYAAGASRIASMLRSSSTRQVALGWLRLNAAAIETLHDARSARDLWRLAAAHGAAAQQLEAHRAIARLSLQLGDFDSARDSAQSARALAHALGDARSEAAAALLLGTALRLRGEVAQAIAAAEAAAALARSVGDKPTSARALTELATLTKNKGDYIRGLDYEIQALREEPPGEDIQAQAATLSKLGKLYEQIEDNTQALAYADRALALADGHAGRETLAHVLVSYANVLNDLSPEQHERALGYARRALDMSMDIGNRPLEVDSALQVARAHFIGGDLPAAGQMFERALRVAKTIGQKVSVAHILLRRSELIEREGRLGDAVADTRTAIDLYRDSDNLPRLIKAYAILERQLDANGEHAAAQGARLQRFELRDRVLGASAMRTLAQMEASRLQESQLQEIELLRRQGEIDALTLERGNMLRWISILCAGLLSLALALTVLRFRRSQRTNVLLEGKNREILAQRQALERSNLELQRSAESLALAVSTDALTAAYSRKHGLEMLAAGIAATDAQGSYGVLLIDVDHFKRVNDCYGHLHGDRVLAQIAGHLRAGLRDGDALVRFGGEEFLVLLPRSDLRAARARADMLWQHVAAQARESLPCTISIGVCVLAQLACRNVESLIDGADRALYAAKNSGRNRVVEFIAARDAQDRELPAI